MSHRAITPAPDFTAAAETVEHTTAVFAFVVVPLTPPLVSLWRAAVVPTADRIRVVLPAAFDAVPPAVWLAITLAALAAGTVAHLIDQRKSR